MPTLIVNGTTVEAHIGERLLDTARREALHIGFVCDGNGLCQTCECRILRGKEHLSPLNDIEKVWLTEGQIAEDRRLACQASVRGPGPVEFETRAEEMRQQALVLFSPRTPENEQVGNFFQTMVLINVEHIRRWPANMFYALTTVFSIPFNVDGAQKLIDDTMRITERMTTTNRNALADSERPPR